MKGVFRGDCDVAMIVVEYATSSKVTSQEHQRSDKKGRGLKKRRPSVRVVVV